MASLRESRVAPSTFAAILRRSKFASFDPQIAQIYTTYDGHAYRGNWGLKRPLSLTKRRGQYITIKSIDSHEQQTEWYNAEQGARWIRTASELGKEPSVHTEDGRWFETMAQQSRITFDSDYASDSDALHAQNGAAGISNTFSDPYKDGSDRYNPAHVPNTSSMSPKQFNKYLNHLRRQRPHFKALVTDTIKRPRSGVNKDETDPFLLSGKYPHLPGKFLKEHRLKKSLNWIGPSPHHNAGITYTYATDLTNRFLHHPVPGRVFPSKSLRGKKLPSDNYIVGISGMIAHLANKNAEGELRFDITNLEEHKKPVEFHTKALTLFDAPTVVGSTHSSGLPHMEFEVDVLTGDHIRTMMSNSNPPGSQNYISMNDNMMVLKNKVALGHMHSPSQKRNATLARTSAKRNDDTNLTNINSMIANSD